MKQGLTSTDKMPYTWAMTERQEIRCTGNEKSAFQAAARRAGLSVSEWIRQALLKAAEKSQKAA